MVAMLQHAAAERVNIVGSLRDAAAPDAAQHLYAFLRSASYGTVGVEGDTIARTDVTALIALDAPPSAAVARVAALFPWCALTRDAADAIKEAKAGRGVVSTVRGVVFQGALRDAFERGRGGSLDCARVAGPCATLYAHGAAKHMSFIPECDAFCADAFGDAVHGDKVLPVVLGAKRLADAGCVRAKRVWDRFLLRKNGNRARNTSPKTKRKWSALGLGRERWSGRTDMAKRMVSLRPKLFTATKRCERTRDVIFSVYNYDDATTLYAFMRSLREAGSTSDAVVFTHRAHAALLRVGRKYGARVLEYFASLTDNEQVAGIMARPHMRELKRTFPGPLIKNYKFTFMYCYLLEFGSKYDRAMFADVRDLYFQRDPFAHASCVGLSASTETASLTIEDRKHIHADHYPRHCPTGWEQFKEFAPINSGAFLADVETMLEIVRKSDAVVEACGAGYDQGTFTELIYLDRLDHAVSLATTEFGSVFGMICNSLDVAYDRFGEVRDEYGAVYPVVHQFDRFGELARDLERRMPLDPALLVANGTTCAR